MDSPKNSQARMAICVIIRLLMTLDSTGVRSRRVLFQSVKAKAVLTTASQQHYPRADAMLTKVTVKGER